MRALLLLSALAWLSRCHPAAGLGLNVTEQEENVPVAWDHSVDGSTMPSGIDYEDTEDDEEEDDPAVPMYIVDDSIRVEPVIKPKQTKTDREKNPDKTKRKKNKGKKNKKKKATPCEGEYKNFCIHGECKYLEDLKEVTCKCHQDYFGERCGEQFMKTQKRNDIGNYSTTILVVVAVLLSSISFIAIVIIVIVQVRKTYPQYEEKEERKILRQENGNGHVGV
ncbi:amphiregulin [Terrapene carolina triunguis]|uniref:Amphiregulin n=1 Tax=Terrapene triunguis TaxID=2587831 RepID=A0A674IMA7_9SAUR|nr:amphiregulin [Terrapene carolina triunguis]